MKQRECNAHHPVSSQTHSGRASSRTAEIRYWPPTPYCSETSDVYGQQSTVPSTSIVQYYYGETHEAAPGPNEQIHAGERGDAAPILGTLRATGTLHMHALQESTSSRLKMAASPQRKFRHDI